MPETAAVFVSSTWVDLQAERAAVEDAILRLRETRFVGMEYFGSRAESANDASLDEVDRSDVYVGIFGHRYGSGITEAEYRRARERGIPCFIYLAEGVKKTEDAHLAPLVSDLRRDHIVKEFRGPDNLAMLVTADLHRWLFDQFLTPKLNAAVEGSYPRAEAQALLEAIPDVTDLDPELRTRLAGAGIIVASEVQIGHRYFSLVSTRTFVVGFLMFLAVGGAGGLGYWYFTRPDPPRVLDGEFNVAIADFGEIGKDGKTVASQKGTEISALLYNSLVQEAGLSDALSKIDVERNNVGLIRDEAEATRLAEQMNANLVIWGTLADDKVLPQMLVWFEGGGGTAASFTLKEMEGKYSVRLEQDSAGDSLDARTGAILRFIEGLVHLQSEDFDAASTSFEEAGRIAESEPAGAEVYYMWAAEAARQAGDLDRADQAIQKALAKDPTYGRAYLAQGNLLMARALATDNNTEADTRRALVDQASAAYQKATEAENQVRGRNVDLRGFVGLGNAAFLAAQDSGDDPDGLKEAAGHYEEVLVRTARLDPETTWDISWTSLVNLGWVQCREGNPAQAEEQFAAARDLAKDFDEKAATVAGGFADEPCGGAEPEATATPSATVPATRRSTPQLTPTPTNAPTRTPAPAFAPTPSPVPPFLPTPMKPIAAPTATATRVPILPVAITPTPTPVGPKPPAPAGLGDVYSDRAQYGAGDHMEICVTLWPGGELPFRIVETLPGQPERELVAETVAVSYDGWPFHDCWTFAVAEPPGERTVRLYYRLEGAWENECGTGDRPCAFVYEVIAPPPATNTPAATATLTPVSPQVVPPTATNTPVQATVTVSP